MLKLRDSIDKEAAAIQQQQQKNKEQEPKAETNEMTKGRLNQMLAMAASCRIIAGQLRYRRMGELNSSYLNFGFYHVN